MNHINRLFLSILLILKFNVIFANENDLQSWNIITMTKSQSYLTYSLESQLRFGDDTSRLSQAIIRPSIGYELTKQHSLWLGYGWIYTTKPFSNQSFDEHRLWQQYLFMQEYALGKISVRTRLEERFIEGTSKTGFRLRELIKIQRPFVHTMPFYIVGSNEIFIQVNNTIKTGNNSGFEQNRLFIGFGFYPEKKWSLELGYQSQIINRIGQPTFNGNAIIVNLLGAF